MTGLDWVQVRASGFTLIELVVVIAMLAVLAAIAVPRFLDIASNARVAKLNGALGDMRSAAEIASMRQQLDGTGPNAPVVLGGTTVTMIFRYPTADAAGIPAAAGLTSAEYTFTPLGPSVDITLNEASVPGNCRVTYTRASGLNPSPTFATTTTGC